MVSCRSFSIRQSPHKLSGYAVYTDPHLTPLRQLEPYHRLRIKGIGIVLREEIPVRQRRLSKTLIQSRDVQGELIDRKTDKIERQERWIILRLYHQIPDWNV